ncbi:MAG TPA: extracellular solute-binding protein, partial [Clostridia bacterium]|nr:extracellular solute-binding protein [Clostridia bacterium]
MKRILSLAIVLCLALTLSAMPVQAENEKITLTYGLDLGSTGASVMSSMDENLVMQKLQEISGIDLEFLHPAVGQATEQFNLLVASRELPDIMEYAWNRYAGGIQKAVDDGIIIELNDLLEANAPNYTAFFQESPDLAKQIATDDGMICVFAAYSISNYNCQSGFMIRQDWLDELGLPMPKTIADWEETLLALMDAKDLVSGFAIQTANVYGDMLVGSWNIGSTY